MGTNYYLTDKTNEQRIHVCKVSKGFKPLFHVTPMLIESYTDLMDKLWTHENFGITNEYGDPVETDDFSRLLHEAQDNPDNRRHKVVSYADDYGFQFTLLVFR